MPEKKTMERARKAKRQGKAPTTQAGAFVREEMEHIREGKHGAKNTKQAIAIGLSKARRAGVDLPPPPAERGKKKTAKKAGGSKRAAGGARSKAKRSTKSPSARKSPKRSRASLQALKRQPRTAASSRALSRQGRQAARTKKRTARRGGAKRASAR